jgi:uncharacterized protein YkwD
MRFWLLSCGALSLGALSLGCAPVSRPADPPEPAASASAGPQVGDPWPAASQAPGASSQQGREPDRGDAPAGDAEPMALEGDEADPGPDLVMATPAARRTARPSRKPGDAQAFVDAHNRFRAKHCARPLAWSAKLAQIAQQWANTLRNKGCAFEHSGGSYGENLAAGTAGTLDPEAVVTMWYDEVSDYKFPDGGFSAKTGHFTQVVWRGTTQVGCGRSLCKGMDIWVCEYDPPGNWQGQYRGNVLPRGCR